MASTLKVPEKWFLPDFSHSERTWYEISTAIDTYQFFCETVWITNENEIVLYGMLWDKNKLQNNGPKILYIDKIQQSGLMIVLKGPIPPNNLADKELGIIAIPHFKLGRIMEFGKLNLYT